MEMTSSKKKMMRQLTRSEKVLLILLGALLIFYLAYKFAFMPQAEKMENLEAQILTYEDTIRENNRILRNEGQIKDDWKELSEEREEILANYFPVIDQAQIVYLLDELLNESEVDISDFRFTRPSFESMRDREIAKMDISLPFEGEYGDIIKILKAIEKSPRKILFSSLDFNSTDGDDLLTGTMNLDVLSLEGMVTTDDEVIHVKPINRPTSDPFKPYDDYSPPGSNEGSIGDTNGGGLDPYNPDFNTNPGQPSGPSYRPPIDNNEEDDDFDDIELGQSSKIIPYKDREYNFISNSDLLNGRVNKIEDKSQGLFLALDYDLDYGSKQSLGYIDLSPDKIFLYESMDSLNLIVTSLGQVEGELGFLFKDKDEKLLEAKIVDRIDWVNSKDLKVQLPKDNLTYPLQLEGIYLKFDEAEAQAGELLFSQLESISKYMTYKVMPGDTIYGISNKIYGSPKYMYEILELNNMKVDDILYINRTLRLRYHD